jgi:hypothetical protein
MSVPASVDQARQHGSLHERYVRRLMSAGPLPRTTPAPQPIAKKEAGRLDLRAGIAARARTATRSVRCRNIRYLPLAFSLQTCLSAPNPPSLAGIKSLLSRLVRADYSSPHLIDSRTCRATSHFIIRGCLLSVSYRKALPKTGRAFQFVDHRDGVILN